MTKKKKPATTELVDAYKDAHRPFDNGKASAPALTWTKTPPTAPGWYWAVFARRVECRARTRIEDFTLWAGPIEPPALPEGES